MRKIFLLLLLLNSSSCIVNRAFAQAPPVLWSRCYGGSSLDDMRDVIQTSDGGFVMDGESLSNDGDVSGNHGGYDYWIVKTDDFGNLQWQKCLGGSSDETANSIRQTQDGGYIVSGITSSIDGDVNNNLGGTDIWIVKMDNFGNILWQKTLGGSGQDGANVSNYGLSIIEYCSDGGYILGTSTSSNDSDVTGNHGGFDYWLVKLDSAGNIQWQKCYGGSSMETLKDMRPTQDGGYILAGVSISTDGDVIGNDSTHGGSWIVKTDSTGNIQWQAIYYCIDTLDPSCNGQISVSSILPLSNGEYLSAGTIYHYGLEYSFCTTSISASGNILNHNPYLFSLSEYHFICASIEVTSDSGFTLSGWAGDAGNDIFIYKSGNLGVWRYRWDSTNTANSEVAAKTIQISDGGFLIGGTSEGDSVCGSSFDPRQFRLIKLGGVLPVEQYSIPKNISCLLEAENLYLKFTSSHPTNLRLALQDLTGRILHQSHLTAIPGTNKKEIPIGDLAKGIYIVTLSGEEGSESVKVSKE